MCNCVASTNYLTTTLNQPIYVFNNTLIGTLLPNIITANISSYVILNALSELYK